MVRKRAADFVKNSDFLFLNARLRFGGNHVDPLGQSLNAEIKNLYVQGSTSYWSGLAGDIHH